MPETPSAARRNPPWSREELILALELYLKRRPTLPGEADPDILALSALLRDLSLYKDLR